jgi:2-aminoethylphosphonate-pyruvate transaminase
VAPTTILFTPGPVKIPARVARALHEPPCNYHRQDGFRAMFAQTVGCLKSLLGLRRPDEWSLGLLTCTGTGANDACLHALAGAGRGMILHNGFFAARLVDQARQGGIDHVVVEGPVDRPFDPDTVDAALARHADVRWLYLVSHETRAGLKNPLEEIGRRAKRRGLLVGADVVSSAFAYPIDLEGGEVDLAVTSSAKALMAVPGIGIVYARNAALDKLGRGKSYYLDLVAEIDKQRKGNETRFAQPVVLHAALHAACLHMVEVGVEAHMGRVQRQMATITAHLATLGVEPMLDERHRSNVAVNFRLPAGLEYPAFARAMEEAGYYLLYGIPGDMTHFQVSTIGDLEDAHVDGLCRSFSRILSNTRQAAT